MHNADAKLFRRAPLISAVLPLAYTMIPSFDMMRDLYGICLPEIEEAIRPDA